ncbi:MAG TPA: glutathione transferase GstA [Rhodanobacteraceae bacterium]|nr:glutathione transferase GstA [Rhodanobacteraceae bacterium]
MRLYYAQYACSLAPHVVAREAGIPIELVEVDISTHTLKNGADYFAINPRGYVPALELDDGTVLTEVAAIVQYLADLKPESNLVPKAGTFERVKLQAWLTFVGTELHKQFSPWLFHAETAESTVQAIKAKIASRFAELDRTLAVQPYLMGEHFTIADAYAFAIVRWAPMMKMDLGAYPSLAAWLARVGSRATVRQAIATEQTKREAA